MSTSSSSGIITCWKRFVHQITASNRPSSNTSLHRSAAEWQRLSELLHSLMRHCPPSRLAVLEYMVPFYGDYFVAWWQHKHSTDFGTDSLDELDLAEPVLIDLMQLVDEVLSSSGASEEFLTGLTSWVLARLRPVSMIAPIQLLSVLKRSITALLRPNKSASRKVRGPTPQTNVSDIEQGHDSSPIRKKSISSRPAYTNNDLPTSDTNSDSDSPTVICPRVVPDPQSASLENLDFDPESAVNAQLLPSWTECRLLRKLLELAFHLLLGKYTCFSTVRVLLANATIPPLPTDVPPTTSTNHYPAPEAVLPHWILVWLVYQARRLGVFAKRVDTVSPLPESDLTDFINLILQAALMAPSASELSYLPDVTSNLEIVAGWISEQRGLDTHFWITVCLNHLLFIGDDVVEHVDGWLAGQLNTLSKSLNSPSTTVVPLHNLALIMLHIGLLTVPTPPAPSVVPTTSRYGGQYQHLIPMQYPIRPPDLRQRPPPHGGGFGSSWYQNQYGLQNVNPPGLMTRPLSTQQPPGRLFPFTNDPPPSTSSVNWPPTSLPNYASQPDRGHPPSNSMRLPTSLAWLLQLTERLRWTCLSNLTRFVQSLNLPSLIDAIQNRLSTDAVQSEKVLHLTCGMLLTAPVNSNVDKLVLLILDAASSRDAERLWFAKFCTSLLESLCTATLCMVYSSAECADSLNRNGCEGMLHAIGRLIRDPIPICPTSSDHHPRLFDYVATEEGKFTRLTIPVTKLIIAGTVTGQPNLAAKLLLYLCTFSRSENKARDDHVLRLFHPLLEELGLLQNAHTVLHPQSPSSNRLSRRSQCHYSFNTIPSTYIHRLLVDHFLPILWDVLLDKNGKSVASSVLESLVWLVEFEFNWSPPRAAGRCRLLSALATQLIPFLKYMHTISVEALGHLNSLVTLLEYISTIFVGTVAPTTPTKSSVRRSAQFFKLQFSDQMKAPSLLLSPNQCFTAGIHFVNLVVKLFQQIQFDHNSPRLLGLLYRVESVFHRLAAIYPLLLQTAIGSALSNETIMCVLYQSNPKTGHLDTLLLPSSMATHHPIIPRQFLFDRSRFCSPTCLPDSIGATGPTNWKNESLLLSNPPKSADTQSDSPGASLVRGEFRRNPLSCVNRSSNELKRRLPGSHSQGFGVVSCSRTDTIVTTLDSFSGKQYLLCHWLHFVQRLINSSYSRSTSESPDINDLQSLSDSVFTQLDSLLLPRGLYLPQTSLKQLPSPLTLVLPPTSIGLERVLSLVHIFCPELKAHATGHLLTRQRTANSILLLQFWLNMPWEIQSCALKMLCSNPPAGSNRKHENHSFPDAYPRDAIEFSNDSTRRPLVRNSRLILGLLQGLEASWASPLAPRIQVAETMVFLTEMEGRHAQGLFPVPWSTDVCTEQARKLAVEYGHRRADRQSALFNFTKNLLLTLCEFCSRHDRYFYDYHHSKSTEVSRNKLSPSWIDDCPLDQFLYLLTARELAILLSDVRRNFRLRLAFDQYHVMAHQSSPLPTACPTVSPISVLSHPPSFMSPGLLIALLQSHLVERNVAELVGPLLRSICVLQRLEFHLPQRVLQEVDIDGETMVILDD